jgi:hypothetical protein
MWAFLDKARHTKRAQALIAVANNALLMTNELMSSTAVAVAAGRRPQATWATQYYFMCAATHYSLLTTQLAARSSQLVSLIT